MELRRRGRVRVVRPLLLVALLALLAPSLWGASPLAEATVGAAQGGDADDDPLTLPLRGDVPLTLPMRGNVRVIGFAPDHPDGYHRNRDRWAVDLTSSEEEVYATAPGWVLFADWDCRSTEDWCFGETVVIDHGGGLYSLYAHLEVGSLVEQGSFVNSTTVIGKMSNTGCPGPSDCTVHLHFAVREDPVGVADVLHDDRLRPHQIYGVIPRLPEADAFRRMNIPGVGTSPIPGGMWIESEIDGDVLRLAAHAYPNPTSPYEIAYVNFTLTWPGRAGPWLLACPPIAAPVRDDRYECTANLRQLEIPADNLRVSFDVYDLAGNNNLAPHGTKRLRWSAASTSARSTTLGVADSNEVITQIGDPDTTSETLTHVEAPALLPPELHGTWSGTGLQVNPAAEWPIVVELTGGSIGDIVGTVSYPSVPCRGQYVLQHVAGTDVEAMEMITENSATCIDGPATFQLAADDTLRYDWSSPDGETTATAILARSTTGAVTTEQTAEQLNPSNAEPVFLTFGAADWQGGLYRGDGAWYGRPWVAIYGAHGEHPSVALSFTLNAAPTGAAMLTLTGLDDELPANTAIEVAVNGVSTYAGPSPFANWDGQGQGENAAWTEAGFTIPSEVLAAGNNEIVVSNLEPTANFGAPPYVLLADAWLEIP